MTPPTYSGGIWISVRDISTEPLQNMQTLTERIAIIHNFLPSLPRSLLSSESRADKPFVSTCQCYVKNCCTPSGRVNLPTECGTQSRSLLWIPLAQPRMLTMKLQEIGLILLVLSSEFYLATWDGIGCRVCLIVSSSIIYYGKPRSISISIKRPEEPPVQPMPRHESVDFVESICLLAESREY